jgi:predicted transcriptional regulator
MANQLQGYKIIIFSMVILLILFSLTFIDTSIAVDDFDDDDGFKSINIDDRFIIEVSEDTTFNKIDIPIQSNNNITIKYPNSNIKVIPPEGSKIIGVSNNSIDIILNEREDSIKYEDTMATFCPINFKTSIKGTEEYELEVYNNLKYCIDESTKEYFTYSIDWGNGDTTEGYGLIPSISSYNYSKQGVYPLTITLTDNRGIKYIYQKNQTFKLSTDQYVKLWTVENKETVAAGSAGSIGILTLLGIALTETGKYKILALLLLAIPMFTKIQKEDVLDHFVRGQIYGYIKAYPGAHYNQIMRELEIKNGTLSYHLYILEKTGTIKSRKEGFRYRAFYPTEVKFPEEERYRLTELQINIIKIIQENRGVNQKYIAKKLDENHQTISYNIKVLQQAGIINTNRKGRKICCFVNQKLSDKLPI